MNDDFEVRDGKKVPMRYYALEFSSRELALISMGLTTLALMKTGKTFHNARNNPESFDKESLDTFKSLLELKGIVQRITDMLDKGDYINKVTKNERP